MTFGRNIKNNTTYFKVNIYSIKQFY